MLHLLLKGGRILLTGWRFLSFTNAWGQKSVLLSALRVARLQVQAVWKPRAPLGNLQPCTQNSKSLKREVDTDIPSGDKTKMGANIEVVGVSGHREAVTWKNKDNNYICFRA
jgi:hypothetical protein